MKKRILAAILATVILLTLAGCGASTQEKAPVPDSRSQTVPATIPTATDLTSDTEHTNEKNSTTKETSAAVTDETQEPYESETELEATQSAATTKPQTEKPAEGTTGPEKPKPAEPTEKEETKPQTTTPETTVKSPETTKPSTEEPKETEPAETKPPATEKPPVTTEPPIETEPPKVTEPEPEPFDIAPWIAYAKSYASGKGLVLSDDAVDCWDNPIRAGAHCIYLERDIQSRLNRYANDEDITDVWIWAEPVGNDCYDIYIGYA